MKGKILAIGLILASCLLEAGIYRIDFGKSDGQVREGFTATTEKDGGLVAWGKTGKLEWRYRPYSYEWKMDSWSMRNRAPVNYPNELSCDYVQGKEQAELTLKVPAGSYRIWVLSGNAGESTSQVWDISVSCGKHRGGTTFSGLHELMDFELDGEAGADGLKLVVSTRSRWLLNAIVAVSRDEWKAYRDGELAAIRRECFELPPAVLEKWKERPVPCPHPELTWTDEQRGTGLVVYSRPWCEPVWPDHFPAPGEIGAPVRTFAAQNDYEPLTFTLYPLRDFERMEMRLGSLVNETGKTFPADRIDVRYVRYLNVRTNYNAHGIYYRAPDALMPWKESARLKKGENFRFWLTFGVRFGTPAGLYKGEAIVTCDGKEVRVPITLRVLPFMLERDETIAQGQYYRSSASRILDAPDDFSREWWQYRNEKEFEHMRDTGMNTFVSSVQVRRQPNGKWSVNVDAFQNMVDLYRKMGFNKPIPVSFDVHSSYRRYVKDGRMGSHLNQVTIPEDGFFDEITEIVRTIQAEVVRRQWPELLYYPVDEPSTSPTSVEFMRRILKAIKLVPGARTYITADPAHQQFEPLRPYVDVWCCQPFSLSKEVVEANMASREGLEYWCYPNHISGENDHTPTRGARMTYGFGLWNSGFRCLIPWIYSSGTGSQWNNLDGDTADFVNRTDEDGSPIPVTLWEAYREGIDDGRYINTLEKWIGTAQGLGFEKEAAAAQEDLEMLRKAIYVQPKYKDKDLWSAETFDVYRWVLASHILNLRALCGY